MSASMEAPVTITADAEGRIEELGMRKELEQMIAYVRAVVPGLAAIEVTVAERYDTGGEPGITIEAYSDRVFEPGKTVLWDLTQWEVTTFPPQVLEQLCILFSTGRPNAR